MSSITTVARFVKGQQAQPGPHVPIFVLTAACDAAAWAAKIEATGYLGKPFALADLDTCVKQHVSVR